MKEIPMLENEYWWGGSTLDGSKQPFCKETSHTSDFRTVCHNQTMPMYLSNKGRVIWSDEPFKVTIENGKFTFDSDDVMLETGGSTLRDAYLYAMRHHFPFSHKKLPEEFFKTAQYNTWMQFTYDPTEEGVLRYAHDIIDHGYKPGILIIDEGWHGRYGVWEFDKLKFPDPKRMIDELHSLGFKVMLWVVPYVTADGLDFLHSTMRLFNPENYDKQFLRTADGKIAIISWWNGYSAALDMTKQIDRDYLDNKLQHLMTAYGVDGFKFDGGHVMSYAPWSIINGKLPEGLTPAALNIAWNEFGEKYKFHEYKDTYRGGGKAVIQRLCDRHHSWDKEGINTLIPVAITQGLVGHPYICPDMIGGGEWTYRTPEKAHLFDPELFVRMAECSALFPMMQFSWAPWEALSEEYQSYVLKMAELHAGMADEILALVENTRLSGEPMLRSLEYNYPGHGYCKIHDQFMLGEDIMAAPVITKGVKEREVVFPEGSWQSQSGDGTVYSEGIHTVPAPLGTLLWFRRV